MVRFYHLLSIATQFSLELPRVEGSLFLPKLPALRWREPSATTTLEEAHVTNRCDGGSQFHQTLGLVKRLVGEREAMLEVPESELYSLLDQIDILRDQVTGMLPSGSTTSISTDEPDNEPQSNPSGEPSQQSQTPSTTLFGGAFIETSEEASQESPGGSGSTDSAQDSAERTEEELQEPPEETSTSSLTESLTEQTGGEHHNKPVETSSSSSPDELPNQTEAGNQEPSGKTNASSFTERPTEQTGEKHQEPPKKTILLSSPDKLQNQTVAENREPPGETKASSYTRDLTEQTGADNQVPPGETIASSYISELTEQTVAGHQEPLGATSVLSTTENSTEYTGEEDEKRPKETNTTRSYGSLTEQTEDLSPKTTHCVGVRQVSGLNPFRRDFNCATGTSATTDVQGQSSAISTSPKLADGVDQDIRTSATKSGVEASPQTTTPASLTVPPDLAQAPSVASKEPTAPEKTREFRTTVLTSTNTTKSTVTRTTTRTKFFYVPLASFDTRLGAGWAGNATATPTPNNEDTSETPAIRLPVMKVPDTDTSADETRLSGFKTLSRPTNSVGEGTV